MVYFSAISSSPHFLQPFSHLCAQKSPAEWGFTNMKRCIQKRHGLQVHALGIQMISQPTFRIWLIRQRSHTGRLEYGPPPAASPEFG